MNQDTVKAIAVLSIEEREKAALELPERMSLTPELSGMVLKAAAGDYYQPNYTSPADLVLALQKSECILTNEANSSTISAISGKVDASRIDDFAEEVTESMFNSGFDELRADQQFVSVLQLMLAIDNIKIAKFGQDASTVRSNYFAYIVASRLLECMPLEEESMQYYESVNSAIDLLRKEKPYYDWFFAKSDRILALLRRTKDFTQQAEELSLLYKDQEVSKELIEDVNLVFEAAVKKRTYGIKQCYVRSLNGGSWVFDDPMSISNDVLGDKTLDEMRRSNIPKLLMLALQSPEEDLESTSINVEAVQLYNGAMIERSKVGFAVRNGLQLGSDGELYLDSNQSLPLRELFELAGARNAYEVMRAELIGHFADLVMPAIIVMGKKFNPELTQTDNENSSAEDIIGRLILPRKTYLLATETEIEKAEETENNDMGSSIREHGVVYHQRRLLPNQKPSPEALQRAVRHGMTLAPGKTFVRAHQRGSGPGRILGHEKIKV